MTSQDNPQPAPAAPHYPLPTDTTVAVASNVVAVAPGVATGDKGDAEAQAQHALAHDLKFTLTIGEAQALYRNLGRRPPSERSLQRYCAEGRIAGQKITTSFGSEWLVNEESLVRHIETQPIIGAPEPSPSSSLSTVTPLIVQHVTSARPTPAPTASLQAPTQSMPPQPPAPAADDSDESDAAPVGERRKIADVLLENARLVATIEGRDQIIAEMKGEQEFLREEVKDARTMRRDVTRITERMLGTLQVIATKTQPQLGSPDAGDAAQSRQ
jgi:hypothetical protein